MWCLDLGVSEMQKLASLTSGRRGGSAPSAGVSEMASTPGHSNADPTRSLWLLEKQQCVLTVRTEGESAFDLNVIFGLAYDRARRTYLLIGDFGESCSLVVLNDVSAQDILRQVQLRRLESIRDQGLEGMQTGSRLNRKEILVLQAVADGLTNRAVASRLRITENTTKRHLQKIFAKLGVQSRTQAVMVGLRRGWLSSISDMQVER
jgi:DNA-binding CsgD family transcriptional regulator